MQTDDQSYLIIGGTTKAGTTSVFRYLSAHPDVCASSLKETRFFLDKDYPLPSTNRFNGNNLECYRVFFEHAVGEKIRMEATPDYLYSDQALNIAELLPNAKIVFILRDPIERLVSWYKFAKQRGLLSNAVTFDEYVHMQMNMTVTPSVPVHLRALEQGRYELYLARFRERMPARVLEIAFTELRNNPLEVMCKICEFVGIDWTYYKDFQFAIENESMLVQNQAIERLYWTVHTKISFVVHRSHVLKNLLKIPNRIIKSLISLNRKPAREVYISPNTRALLEEYYSVGKNKDE